MFIRRRFTSYWWPEKSTTTFRNLKLPDLIKIIFYTQCFKHPACLWFHVEQTLDTKEEI